MTYQEKKSIVSLVSTILIFAAYWLYISPRAPEGSAETADILRYWGSFVLILMAVSIAAHIVISLLKAVHDWTFLLGPNFMLGINTMMYSFLFYKSGLLPRFIPLLGMTGAACVFVAALLEMFGAFPQLSVWGAVLSLPVFANEMTLAVWLLAKGFNVSKLKP